MTALTDSSVLSAAHRKALAFLRTLRTADIGCLARELLPGAIAGLAGEHSLQALRLMGVVLTERERTRKVVTR